MDGDDDVDVLSGEYLLLALYENTDGEGTFGPKQIVDREYGQLPRFDSVRAVDLDGDGDLDVLSTPVQNEIAWYENTDGAGTFGSRQVITTHVDTVRSIDAADVDSDGDLDVLCAFSPSPIGGENEVNRVAWYENTDGKGTFGAERVITTQVEDVESVDAADLDGDGDLDVLSASRGETAWYENDGTGVFGLQKVITSNVGWGNTVSAADLDADGDMDVLTESSWGVTWFENVGITAPQAGDANGDWQFDQPDIVQVLQSAKYLTGEPATWQEGDWNGDGVFDEADIVAALQTGNYLQGPYVDVALAEPGE